MLFFTQIKSVAHVLACVRAWDSTHQMEKTVLDEIKQILTRITIILQQHFFKGVSNSAPFKGYVHHFYALQNESP